MTDLTDLTPEEIDRYAPYHHMKAFRLGFADYHTGNRANEYKGENGVYAQAYDRGAECAMRRQRETGR